MKKWSLTDRIGYAYTAPALAVVALLMAFPLLYTFMLSFQKNDVFANETKFVGLRQFARLFEDPVFVLAIRNTVVWTAACVAFQFLLGLLAAVAINQEFVKGKTVIRLLIMVPWVLPGIVGVQTWKWSYHPDFGIINHALKSLGIISHDITWTSGSSTALLSAIIVNVWKMFPFVMLMLEAALQSVPKELKEAAYVDGARPLRIFFAVTMPHIMMTSLTVILLLTIWTFNAFTFIFALTAGGPAHKSEILSLYIYRQGFQNLNFGLASAASVVLFLLTMAFSLVYIRFFMRKGEEA